MDTPLVSIVTPVRNGARFLSETLASVRGQDYARLEHIVIDGGSTDGTLDLLRAAPRIAWTSGPDAGMYDAINRGFRMAKGDILAYQNADDRYVVPGAVSIAVRYFLDHPDADVVYGDFRYIDEDGKAGEEVRGRDFDLRALRRYNFVPPHSAFVRRRAIAEDGLWLDATLRLPGDWDWFLRLARAGRKFAHVPEVLSEFRRHRASTSSTLPWGVKLAEWRRVCRKNGVSFPLLLWYEACYIPLRRRLGLPA
jgi:glycosyltransferase involved in cell wall biosynthesis